MINMMIVILFGIFFEMIKLSVSDVGFLVVVINFVIWTIAMMVVIMMNLVRVHLNKSERHGDYTEAEVGDC